MKKERILNHEKMYRNRCKLNYIYLMILTIIFFLTHINAQSYRILSIASSVINFIIIFLVILNNLTKKIKLGERCIFYLIILISIFSILKNGSNYGGVINIITFSGMIFIARYVVLLNKDIEKISKIYLFLIFFWLFSDKEGLNSNTIGLVSVFSYIGASYYINSIKNLGKRKLLFLILTIITLFLVIKSNSRSSLLCLGIFIVFSYIISFKIWSMKFIYRLIGLIITLGSIVYVHVYIYLCNNMSNRFLIIAGKKFFTGRELIWNELWELFQGDYLWGLGTNIQITSIDMSLNVHNSFYNILVINGVLVFGLILILYLKNFYVNRKYIGNDKLIVISKAALIGISIQSFFEVTITMPNTLGIIFLIFICGNGKIDKNLERDINDEANKNLD